MESDLRFLVMFRYSRYNFQILELVLGIAFVSVALNRYSHNNDA